MERQPLLDPQDPTTVEERLAQVWSLTVEMWALAGKEMPSYARHEAPGKLTRREVR